MAAARPKHLSLAEADLEAAHVWVEAHKATIPLCVYSAVVMLATLRAELSKTKQRGSGRMRRILSTAVVAGMA